MDLGHLEPRVSFSIVQQAVKKDIGTQTPAVRQGPLGARLRGLDLHQGAATSELSYGEKRRRTWDTTIG